MIYCGWKNLPVYSLFLLLFFSIPIVSGAQIIHNEEEERQKLTERKDVFDVVSNVFKKGKEPDSTALQVLEGKEDSKATVMTVLPSINYSLVTRLAFGAMVSGYYYLDKKNNTNLSTTDFAAIYTTQRQLILKMKSTVWPSANRYNFVGDWRYMKYPSFTYGLGSGTKESDKVIVDYKYVRVYQNFFKEISGAFYLGMGYKLDYHYNVNEFSDFFSDFDVYKEGNRQKTIASGPTVNMLYDSRGNLMNPLGGRSYGYLSYRNNFRWTGSDTEWQSLTVDVRKYIRFPAQSTNVLALWSYNWLTFGGNPSYLDLPSTGWDEGNNQGRGYIQGRYRSNNLISFESEYRFSITRNKVFGGVVFGNVQSVSDFKTMEFKEAYPAGGVGIRLKINKNTNTNFSVDFAVGVQGSKTFNFTLGEVF